MFACVKCGKYAVRQFRLLCKPCSPAQRTWRRDKIFVDHLHPSLRVHIVPIGPVAFPAVFDWQAFDPDVVLPARLKAGKVRDVGFDDAEGSVISESD